VMNASRVLNLDQIPNSRKAVVKKKRNIILDYQHMWMWVYVTQEEALYCI